MNREELARHIYNYIYPGCDFEELKLERGMTEIYFMVADSIMPLLAEKDAKIAELEEKLRVAEHCLGACCTKDTQKRIEELEIDLDCAKAENSSLYETIAELKKKIKYYEDTYTWGGPDTDNP